MDNRQKFRLNHYKEYDYPKQAYVFFNNKKVMELKILKVMN